MSTHPTVFPFSPLSSFARRAVASFECT